MGKSRRIRIGIVLSSLAATALAFQNCGKAGFEPVEEDMASTAKPLAPFVFEGSFDQISYNSCFGSTTVPTFQAGAYSSKTGGMKIRLSEFKQITGESGDNGISINGILKPLYPDPHITSIQFRKFISEDENHKGVRPQLSLRYNGLQGINSVVDNDGKVMLAPLLGDLTDDRYLSQLVGIDEVDFRNTVLGLNSYSLRRVESGGYTFLNTKSITSFPLVSTDDLSQASILQGQLSANDEEGTADMFRKTLQNPSAQGISLYLTFNSPADGEDTTAVKRSPAGVPIGKRYQLSFGNWGGRSTTDVLNGVTEFTLETGKAEFNNWLCSQQYFIVREADVVNFHAKADTTARVYFRSLSEVLYFSASTDDRIAFYKEIETARRHFPSSQWDLGFCSLNLTDLNSQTGPLIVNTTSVFRCAIDLGKSCFRHIQDKMTVQYKPNLACFTTIGAASVSSEQKDWCMPAISICNKQ